MKPFRNDTERRQYEHCRDVMFPTLERMKKIASARLAESRRDEAAPGGKRSGKTNRGARR